MFTHSIAADIHHAIRSTDPLAQRSDARQAYEAMLARLCDLAGLAPADRDVVQQQEVLVLDDVALALQFEEWSCFVKVFVEVGTPSAADAEALYRYLLVQQLTMPAPFSLVGGVHPETDAVVLHGCAPLATDTEGDAGFMAFLQGCVLACEALRAMAGGSQPR